MNTHTHKILKNSNKRTLGMTTPGLGSNTYYEEWRSILLPRSVSHKTRCLNRNSSYHRLEVSEIPGLKPEHRATWLLAGVANDLGHSSGSGLKPLASLWLVVGGKEKSTEFNKVQSYYQTLQPHPSSTLDLIPPTTVQPEHTLWLVTSGMRPSHLILVNRSTASSVLMSLAPGDVL